MPRRGRQGNFDTAAVIGGEAVGLIDDIVPAREIIEPIVRKAGTLLQNGPAQVEVGAA